MELEGTHRVRTCDILLLVTLTRSLTFQPQNHITCRIFQGHSLYKLLTHSFWVKLRLLVSKMHLLTLWSWPYNPKTTSLLGYPKVIPRQWLNTLGSFVLKLCCRQTNRQTDGLKQLTIIFELCSRYTDKQTNKLADRVTDRPNILPTPTDSVDLSNNSVLSSSCCDMSAATASCVNCCNKYLISIEYNTIRVSYVWVTDAVFPCVSTLTTMGSCFSCQELKDGTD